MPCDLTKPQAVTGENSRRRYVIRLAVGATVVIALFFALALFALRQSRRQSEERAEITTQNLARGAHPAHSSDPSWLT